MKGSELNRRLKDLAESINETLDEYWYEADAKRRKLDDRITRPENKVFDLKVKP